MDDILSGVPPVVLTTDAPTTIGVNMFEDARARRLFIDVNNEGIKRDADGTNVTTTCPWPPHRSISRSNCPTG